jgi:hypothetical protein
MGLHTVLLTEQRRCGALSLFPAAASSAKGESQNMRSGVPTRNESLWLRGSYWLNPALPHAASDREAHCSIDQLIRSKSILRSGYAEGLGKCFAGQSSLDGRSITLSTLT